MPKYPTELMTLITLLRKLPGVGLRTAERFAFALLEWKSSDLHKISKTLQEIQDKVQYCKSCGCMMDSMRCTFCTDPQREKKQLCILASAKDVFHIEDTKIFSGLYHVLGSLLSPIDGFEIQEGKLRLLRQRIEELGIEEVIIALDATLEGDTTALYIKETLSTYPLKISRLGFGLPLGSALDFVDGGTLARALLAKQPF